MQTSNYLIRRWLRMEGIQMLFIETMGEWPQRYFRDLQGCLFHHRPKTLRGQNDLGGMTLECPRWALCSGLPWDSAPHILAQCSLATLALVNVGPDVARAPAPESASRTPWWRPCGANSADTKSAWAVGPWQPPLRFQRVLWTAWGLRQKLAAGVKLPQRIPI